MRFLCQFYSEGKFNICIVVWTIEKKQIDKHTEKPNLHNDKKTYAPHTSHPSIKKTKNKKTPSALRKMTRAQSGNTLRELPGRYSWMCALAYSVSLHPSTSFLRPHWSNPDAPDCYPLLTFFPIPQYKDDQCNWQEATSGCLIQSPLFLKFLHSSTPKSFVFRWPSFLGRMTEENYLYLEV